LADREELLGASARTVCCNVGQLIEHKRSDIGTGPLLQKVTRGIVNKISDLPVDTDRFEPVVQAYISGKGFHDSDSVLVNGKLLKPPRF
jgi:hypothetical protein